MANHLDSYQQWPTAREDDVAWISQHVLELLEAMVADLLHVHPPDPLHHIQLWLASKHKDSAHCQPSLALRKKSILEVSLTGQRVLLRVDFNVPQDRSTLRVTNPQRIVAALPTINAAFSNGARAVVIMSHLGRPNGQRVSKYSLQPVADKLQELLSRPVTFLDDCVGPAIESACAALPQGSVVLLENLRFHPEEEGGANVSCEAVARFQTQLSQLGDIYVNDAFGAAHRPHSSIVGLKGKMKCVAGLLLQHELEAFSKVLDPAQVKRPLTAIVGGAKVSDKILLLENLIAKADRLIICGAMAYTFMKTLYGMSIGKSLFDVNGAKVVPNIMAKAQAKGVEVVLPLDWVCGKEFRNEQEVLMVSKEQGIPEGWEGLDCGPCSMVLFREKILASRTVVWNGPAGVFEFENFSKGTKAVLDAMAKLTKAGHVGIIGGGDSAAAAAKFDMEDQVTFVSTGGGAALELLEGKILPGIAALDDK